MSWTEAVTSGESDTGFPDWLFNQMFSFKRLAVEDREDLLKTAASCEDLSSIPAPKPDPKLGRGKGRGKGRGRVAG